ncbi:hypothetical protein [Sphingobium yanoikuyae]|uniref:DUF4831 family protein n=1 Tax=Sphingobium yanoikuyae TaxID=13690 RepID=A0A291N045_SPHYA|nr:hypothetical protein [Sphingobium yanoikuyae]ATI80631.1 hypothetical protein A6768_11930 [Sphingobium yanoikuyae]
MKRGIILTLPLLAACTTTSAGSGAGDQVASNQSAAGITYYLPKTKITMTASLVLKSCDYFPEASPTIVVAAVAEADDKPFSISGPNLQSWRLKRDLNITLADNGTISAINSTVSDRTASIVGGVVKFAASIVNPLSGPTKAPTSAYQCNTATQQAIAEVKTLEGKIKDLRAALARQKPAEIKDSIATIDALAARIAALRTGPLMLTVTKDLDLTQTWNAKAIDITTAELEKWFELPNKTDPARIAAARGNYPGQDDASIDAILRNNIPAFRLTYTLQPGAGAPAAPTSAASKAKVEEGCPEDKSCEKTLVFREPVIAHLTINAVDGFSELAGNNKVYEGDLPIAQWGMPTFLSLGTKLLQTRTVDLTFDGFGRKKSFNWKSESKGETLAGALGTAADSVGSFRKALADKTETERNAALVTDLETKKKLNALLACKELLDAGGFTCPGTE